MKMISVVIPVYNSRDTIAGCINSVLNQTEAGLVGEIIVVDDGSSDGSAGLVEHCFKDNSLIRVIRKKNGGVSSARNTGIRAAAYEWIALLDADDIWHPGKIEKQWEQIEKYPGIRFIGCNRNKENVRWGRRISGSLYALDLKHILIKNWPHTSTALIRKDVFKTAGLFNEKMRHAEDGDMWNRIACRYPLFYIPESYETAGGNKLQFGERGLSADLREMHEGNIRNIRVLRKRNKISVRFYVFLRLYNSLKYLNRICITKINRHKSRKNETSRRGRQTGADSVKNKPGTASKENGIPHQNEKHEKNMQPDGCASSASCRIQKSGKGF